MTTVPINIIYFVYGSFLVTLFSDGMLIPVYLISCIYIIWNFSNNFKISMLKKPLILALTVFYLWVSASCFWSIVPHTSMETVLKIWLAGLTGVISSVLLAQSNVTSTKRLNDNVLLIFLVFISIVFIVEHLNGYRFALFLRRLLNYDIYNYGQPMDHATALYSLLLPFCLYHLRGKKSHLTTLIIFTLIVYTLHPMFAAILAVSLAMFTAFIVYRTGYRGMVFFANISVLIIFFMPQIMSFLLNLELFQSIDSLPSSWQERVDIWTRTIELIDARPLLGWGVDTSSDIEAAVFTGGDSVIKVHPHNIPLQLRLETGLVGISLFCIFIGFIWKFILELSDRLFTVTCVASLTIFFGFALFSFNAWHSWWICTQYLAFIIMIAFHVLTKFNKLPETY